MPFHTPPSAEVAGYAGFALLKHSATFSLSRMFSVETRSTNSLLERPRAYARGASKSPADEVGRRTADFIRQLGEQ